MVSRRKRKRYRRQTAPVADGQRGDRTSPPAEDSGFAGGKGQLRGDWATASRSDLLLFRQAIEEDWPVPAERRRPLMEAVLSPIYREDTPVRLKLAIARLAIAADMHDLKLAEAQRKGEDPAEPRTAPRPAAPASDGSSSGARSGTGQQRRVGEGGPF